MSEVEQIQQKLLEIFLYYKDFCEKHNLGFVLAGGTCLGAVRHKGFIPWDDDLDVFMLRDDYEKLIPLWNKYADTERYTCLRSNEFINIHHSATEIKDNNTTFINRHSVDLDIHHGLMIDIIPLDGVAEGKLSKLYQIATGMLYDCYNFQRLPNHKSKFIYYATKIALGMVRSSRLRYKIWRWAERQHSKYAISEHEYVASFGEGLSIMRQHFPKQWFLEPAYLEFEGHSVPVPANTDEYLRISYGDYMQLPPPEEQVYRHDVAFMDLENCYQKYRGIKYYVSDQKNT